MTNRIAVYLGVAVVGAIVLDLFTGLGAVLFLARQIVDVLEWMAFWR